MEQTLEMAVDVGETGGVQLGSEWLTDARAFERLAADWTELADRARSNNAFVSFEWAAAWLSIWGHERTLAIVTVRDEVGGLVGLAPLSIETIWAGFVRLRRLRLLADEYVGSDYLGILAAPGYEARVVGEIVRTIEQHKEQWDTIALHDAVDSPLMGDFCFQLSALGMRCHRKSADLCYYVPLPATHDLFLKSLTSSLRCNYKRRWRVLEREGNVEFVSTTDPAEIAGQFPELVELHRLRFVQRQERSMFAQPRVLAFHAKVLERLKTRPIARLLIIRTNGEAVAALYGFSAGNAFQFYQCGMHPEWKHKGVGQMMIGRAIEESIRLGHAEFDFLRGGEAYKAQWTDAARSTVTSRLFDNRWKGRYAEAVWRASVVARKWKAALREKRAGLNKPSETHADD